MPGTPITTPKTIRQSPTHFNDEETDGKTFLLFLILRIAQVEWVCVLRALREWVSDTPCILERYYNRKFPAEYNLIQLTESS